MADRINPALVYDAIPDSDALAIDSYNYDETIDDYICRAEIRCGSSLYVLLLQKLCSTDMTLKQGVAVASQMLEELSKFVVAFGQIAKKGQ